LICPLVACRDIKLADLVMVVEAPVIVKIGSEYLASTWLEQLVDAPDASRHRDAVVVGVDRHAVVSALEPDSSGADIRVIYPCRTTRVGHTNVARTPAASAEGGSAQVEVA
jgi:hypothetical protein